MGNNYTINQSLEIAEDYLTRLGDEVDERVEGIVGPGDELKGLACKHGTHSYLVLAAEPWEWVTLQYPVNVDQAYAMRRLEMDESINDIQISEAQIQRARSEFDQRLDEMPVTQKREFRLNLIHMLSREGTVLNFDTTSPLNIHGFKLGKKLFIHESNFSISDFHDGVQAVVNLGWVGKEFLLDNYGFRTFDPENGEFSHEGPGPRL